MKNREGEGGEREREREEWALMFFINKNLDQDKL